MLEVSQTVRREVSLHSPARSSPRVRKRSHVDQARDTKKKKIKYQKRRAAGLCAYGYCPEKADPGHSQCERHLQKMRAFAIERRNERIAQGLCISCGERPQFWGRKCILCRTVRSNNPLPYGARRALRLYREAEANHEQLTDQSKLRDAVLRLLANKDVEGKHAEVLRLYAGIEFGKRRTYRQVGKLMNLSRERVRQIVLPLKRTLNAELSGCAIWRARKPYQPGALQRESTSLANVCSACGTDASRILPGDSYLYVESGLPKVVITGVEFYRCYVCRQRAIKLPSRRELDAALINGLIWKQGPLTGNEVTSLRVAANLTADVFAERLGVAKLTLKAWESSRALRYRDDLLVRVVMSSLRVNQDPTDLQSMVKAIKGKSPKALKIDLRVAETEGLKRAPCILV